MYSCHQTRMRYMIKHIFCILSFCLFCLAQADATTTPMEKRVEFPQGTYEWNSEYGDFITCRDGKQFQCVQDSGSCLFIKTDSLSSSTSPCNTLRACLPVNVEQLIYDRCNCVDYSQQPTCSNLPRMVPGI